MNMHRVLTTLGCALTAVLATAWSAPPPTDPAGPAATTVRMSVPAQIAAISTTVRTPDGRVRGTARDGYRTFEGIPYATPRSARCVGRRPPSGPLVRGTGRDPARERLSAAGR
ncbi:hypothetical protein O1M63_44000 [Streptomyces mirabilis]|nr:hypothetical protein [Streptomyces mirabilis]